MFLPFTALLFTGAFTFLTVEMSACVLMPSLLTGGRLLVFILWFFFLLFHVTDLV